MIIRNEPGIVFQNKRILKLVIYFVCSTNKLIKTQTLNDNGTIKIYINILEGMNIVRMLEHRSCDHRTSSI